MARLCCDFLPLSLLLLVAGCGILQCQAVKVNVLDSENKTCIYGDMMINFTVTYKTSKGEYKNASIEVPDNATTNGSFCGNATELPLLKINFGESDGHSWSISFENTSTTYRGHELTFIYNTNDTKSFPDAEKIGKVTVKVNDTMPATPLNTVYRCNSVDTLVAENVTEIFWNVRLQAFVENGTVGKNETVCQADRTTTPAPTTIPANTTTVPANATTVPATTAVPTTPPIPGKPSTGNYSVSGKSGDICLLATLGLQLNYSYTVNKTSTWKVLNINPNVTHANGTCENGTSTLTLDDNSTMILNFKFAINNSTMKFYLKEVFVNITNSAPFDGGNSSLNYWQASLGSSYMCNKEQNYKVTENLTLNTFDLIVQPFNVTKGQFSKAEDCSADRKDNYIIPIAVGAALGGLVIIVIVAYVIGRRRTKAAGYEQFA